MDRNDGEIIVGFRESNARMKGFGLSSGRYVTFLDSDDYFSKDKLRIQVDFLEKHKQYVACSSDFIGYDYFGNSENKLLLDFFSAKFAFSTKDSYTFFYVEEDGIPVIYNNTSFTCQLEISLEDEGSIIVQEHEEIPLRYRGKEVTAYLVLPNI